MINCDKDFSGLPALILGDDMEPHCPACVEPFDFPRAKMLRVSGIMHCQCPDCCSWSILPPAWETASSDSFPLPAKVQDKTDIIRLLHNCDPDQTEIIHHILVKMAAMKAQRWSGQMTFALDYHMGLLGDMQVNRNELVRLTTQKNVAAT